MTREITVKDCIQKFFLSGDSSGLGQVGILLAELWKDKVLSVIRVNHRIATLRLLVGKITLPIFYVYALECGRPCEEKDDFYLVLISSISIISSMMY